MKRNGFILVELSIVLVIIGLLIGGILAAQSMISTSKVEAVAMQIGQFDASVENFKTKYNSLPGDSLSFGGDGDGLLTSCCGGNLPRFMGEIGRFWNNIYPNEYADCSGQCRAIYSGANKNVPLAKFGANNSFFIASALSINDYSSAGSTENYYVVLNSAQLQTKISGEWMFSSTNPAFLPSAVKPADLLSLDKKIDDGIANLGNVKSGAICCGESGSVYNNPLAACNSGSTYIVATTTEQCTPLIRIGASAGDPQ